MQIYEIGKAHSWTCFLNYNLIGEVCLEMLQNAIKPLILEILKNNSDEFSNLKEIMFQQDSALGQVRRYLEDEYGST